MTWLELPEDTLFGLENLPYGVFSHAGEQRRRAGIAIGDSVLDLSAAAEEAAAPFAALLTSGVLTRCSPPVPRPGVRSVSGSPNG